MANFEFLSQYRVASSEEEALDKGRAWKHMFIPLRPFALLEAENELGFRFPAELDEFYSKIGYGFFHNNLQESFNRFLSPDVVAQIHLRQDQYEFDPDLELYEDQDHIIFFEVNEGVYLTIDRSVKGDKSPVYYVLTKVSDSLEEFLRAYDKDPEYLNKLDDTQT